MKYKDSVICGYNNSSVRMYPKVNRELNQRNFNFLVLPCPGWGVRGRFLSKIKELLTFNSILVEVSLYLACLFLIWGKK